MSRYPRSWHDISAKLGLEISKHIPPDLTVEHCLSKVPFAEKQIPRAIEIRSIGF
jgi:hypothetical protein